jgi:hypothetical protein
MSSGIALQFKDKFKNVDSIKRQKKRLTEVAHLKINNKWILYLITKEKYYENRYMKTFLKHYKIPDNFA